MHLYTLDENHQENSQGVAKNKPKAINLTHLGRKECEKRTRYLQKADSFAILLRNRNGCTIDEGQGVGGDFYDGRATYEV